MNRKEPFGAGTRCPPFARTSLRAAAENPSRLAPPEPGLRHRRAAQTPSPPEPLRMPAPLNQLPWDVAKDGSSGINWSPSPLRSLGPGCSRRAVGAGLRQQALVGGLVKTSRKEELAAN